MTNPDLLTLANELDGMETDAAGKCKWSEVATVSSALRRLASSDGGVKVKPLVWRDHRPDSFPEPAWSAQTSFGFYNIEEVSASDSPAYVVRLHAHHFVADKDSLDEAKAAAQADYESRIKSALVEVPAVKGEPEPVAWPANLNPRTLDLVQRFALALAKKLRLAEEKYDHTDGWLRDDWESECRDHLYQHLEKGDPRDVAAYCAFMWHHDWITCRPVIAAPPADAGMREALERCATICERRAKQCRRAADNPEMTDAQQEIWAALCNENLDNARAFRALTAPGATTKSDGGDPTSVQRQEAMRLLKAEDDRQLKLHDLLETIREQIRIGVEPQHRPEGLFKNIQDAVYAMRGRTPLMNDAAITCVLVDPSDPSPTRSEVTVETLKYAEKAFDQIRLTLIKHLDEPARSAFWQAVEGREVCKAALLETHQIRKKS